MAVAVSEPEFARAPSSVVPTVELPATPSLPERAPEDLSLADPFHDPLLQGLGIFFIVTTVVMFALLGLLYWGVQYQQPSWNANSVPPSIVH